MTKRFWVGWWSGYYKNDGCCEPPVQFWVSGLREHRTDTKKTEMSMVAVIDAEDEAKVWEGLKQFFPDLEQRFCNEVESDWQPGERFSGFENRTRLEVGCE